MKRFLPLLPFGALLYVVNALGLTLVWSLGVMVAAGLAVTLLVFSANLDPDRLRKTGAPTC